MKDGALLAMLPASCWAMLEAVFAFSDSLAPGEAQKFMAVASFALLTVLFSGLALYNRVAASARDLVQARLENKVAEMAKEHSAQIDEAYSQISTLSHDLHHHMAAIAAYLKMGDCEAADKYAQNLSKLAIEAGAGNYLGHPALSALIESRRNAAEKDGIGFSASIGIPKPLPVSDTDLCVLFGSLLDNAFEACQSAYEPRFIKLRAQVKGSYWAVACTNSIADGSKASAIGSLKSTKGEAGHGLGTKQIQRIAESTGGYAAYEQENYAFSAVAMLMLDEASQ
jgi:sensor histidine kinase regulating citrate/malate metabolism